MDRRAAAEALTQIAVLLELHGEAKIAVQGMQTAARLVGAGEALHMAEPLADWWARTGAGDQVLTPDARAVLDELSAHAGSSLLERLQEETPEGLLDMLRVPGLGPARVRAIHDGLAIESLLGLEQAARDGRLAALPRFGDRTADKIRQGIADLRATGTPVLWSHAQLEAEALARILRTHQDVLQVEIAGSIRRHADTVRDIDLVVAVRGEPQRIAPSLADLRGVQPRSAVRSGSGPALALRLDTGMHVDLYCVRPEQLPLALWRATGSEAHVAQLVTDAAARGWTLAEDALYDATGTPIPIADEAALYARLGLAYIAPVLREAAGELEAARTGTLPTLVHEADLRGALHCHSLDSDGGAAIAPMAEAARARGLRYLGVSDHSQSNTYAGGMSRDAIEQQHDLIDQLNAEYAERNITFRILKGIEADILPCGRLDYESAVLDRFDFVIGSIHTRYGMNAQQMTERVLKALDDPHLTILGHPTGRLLLTREPYAIDLDAICEKAARVGVAVELNADPHRLDIDWQGCRIAKRHGTCVSIGPDAHAPAGFDNLTLGVAVAQKGWLEASDVLNTRSADALLAFARRRRETASRA